VRELRGRVAFVTGAASGIGLGTVRSLARAGMRVAMGDIEEAALEKARSEIAASGADVRAFRLDVSEPEQVERAAAEAERAFGRIHVIFNNAGVGVRGPLDEMSVSNWAWVVGVNLIGVANGIRSFVPRIKAQGEGGHVVNTASMAGLIAPAGLGIYNATKYAVVGISETLRAELAPQGIGVSVLCPGLVNTNIFTAGRNRPERYGGPGETLESIRQAAQQRAMDPAEAGECVRRGIEEDRPYIFTHPEIRAAFDARVANIHADLEHWARSAS
jgi:NAD(P)-dependent dehydrogenase (short-subunit alcohol dehydrogenase family)